MNTFLVELEIYSFINSNLKFEWLFIKRQSFPPIILNTSEPFKSLSVSIVANNSIKSFGYTTTSVMLNDTSVGPTAVSKLKFLYTSSKTINSSPSTITERYGVTVTLNAPSPSNFSITEIINGIELFKFRVTSLDPFPKVIPPTFKYLLIWTGCERGESIAIFKLESLLVLYEYKVSSFPSNPYRFWPEVTT